MSVGLYLKAKVAKPRLSLGRRDPVKTLNEVKAWFLDYSKELYPSAYIGTSEDHPTLFCRLHPAAEDVELSFVTPDELTAAAKTSTVGPGYHIYICDMLHALGSRFRAEWEPESDAFFDEAHYFFTHESERVFAEMEAWLGGLAGSFFDGTIEPEGPVRLSLPLDIGFSSDEPALTPTGPRSMEWLLRAWKNAAMGRDFFSWWRPGLNADYYLGRALARIWADVRWRPPFRAQETGVLTEVADCLHKAYKLDPALDYPWPEWAEILRLLDRKRPGTEFVFNKAGDKSGILGYRRREVNLRLLGNWWITVPGSFTDFVEEDDALHAWDTTRGVFFSAYRFDNPETARPHWRSETKKLEHELYLENERWVAAAEITKSSENGQDYFALKSSNIGDESRCVCTVVFEDERDRDWAIGVWKSLEPPPAKKD